MFLSHPQLGMVIVLHIIMYLIVGHYTLIVGYCNSL